MSKRWALLTALLIIGLSGSVLLNIRLFKEAKHYYFELIKTQLDPVGSSKYPADVVAETDIQKLRLVFFGDSRAAGWAAPNVDNYEFINRGIGGQTSVQTSQRFDDHVRPLQPDVVLIQVGINDLKAIALFPERREAIIANCKAHIQQVVAESRKLGAVVILTTIFPVGEVPLERRPFWSDDVEAAIQDVNDYIFTLADEQVLILDTLPVLADAQGRLLPEYGKDELHLNAQGYVALNGELTTLLSAIE